MDKGFAPAVASIPTATRKAAARAALIGLKEGPRTILSECFKQFGIDVVTMSGNAAEHMTREKFEACVVPLSKEAEAVMHSARTSPSNSRMIIYGVGGTVHDALRFSKYGINAVFNEPLERPAALKLVRATQMLVMHEFRRYVRIPVITEVAVTTGDNRRMTATSRDLSSGGMSIHSADDIASGAPVEISFALLTLPRIWVRGNVTWRKAKNFGVRFDQKDERRFRIKEWIDAYLEN